MRHRRSPQGPALKASLQRPSTSRIV
jgi:hypothetical protein